MLGHVVPASFCLHHLLSSERARHFDRTLDVSGLPLLLTTDEQNYDLIPAPGEVHPISGPVVDSHLGNTVTDGLHVTWVAPASRATRT
ncbi:MAG: hypothetical protein ACJAYU_002680 [Bradymonadia bacterium]